MTQFGRKSTLLAAALFLAAGCTNGEFVGSTDDDRGGFDLLSNTGKGVATLVNHRQAVHAMYAVTGLPFPNNTIQNFYNNNVNTLSQDGHAEGTGAAQLLKLTEMVSLGCQQGINNRSSASSKFRFLTSVNFGAGPQGLDEAERRELANNFAKVWWQRDGSPQEVTLLVNFMGLFDGEAPAGRSNSNRTTDLLIGVCTVAGASLGSVANGI